MDHKLQKVFVTIFMGLLTGMAILLICMPKQQFSVSERRRLSLIPKLTADSIEDKTYMNSMEEYLLDHFPFREQFRRIKAYYAYGVLQQKENNDIYVAEGYAGKLEYPLQQSSVEKACARMMTLQEQYFPDAQTYYAIVPDKNYYLADKQYPILDYARLDEMIQAEIPSVQKINLYDKLHLEDYYRTDLHWKQEKITDVVDTLVQSMGQQTNTISDGWQIATEDFVGAYGAASALKTTPDKMIYRTDPSIERMQVYDYERKQYVSVYAPEKIGGMDDYDFYLWGARALLTIQNPECHNGKKLLLFRDSFGSSIAPLLAEYYEEVTLVDLRYVSASHALELLGDTEYQDVLFLYSAPILNHGDSLRFG